MNNQLTGVSLFSGCDGFGLGFTRIGGHVIEAHEFDVSACEVHEKVMGSGLVQHTDLRRKDPYTLPDADIYFGGPPCQAFSGGNKFASPDNAKNLWPATIEIVRIKRPAFFAFENVTGLVYRHTAYFNWIVDQFKAMGYRVETRILNAADYGVAQTRQRVFIVGRLDNQAWSWPTPTHTESGDMFSHQWISWKEVLPTNWNKTASEGQLPKWVALPKYQQIPENALVNCKDMIKNRLHRDAVEPSFTLTTECIKRNFIVLDGKSYRSDAIAMTRLQSLPDIEMPSHVIGNAVPPLLAQAVFEAAFEREMVMA
jgi:DNA (cytosine-5)-methyltransferase 1